MRRKSTFKQIVFASYGKLFESGRSESGAIVNEIGNLYRKKLINMQKEDLKKALTLKVPEN